MSDRLDLDAIKARADAATSGPWAWEVDTDLLALGRRDSVQENHVLSAWRCKRCVERERHCLWPEPLDAEFIAHAREDIPALVAEVERLRSELDKAQLAYIEATNPGIDMERVRESRAGQL